MPIIWLLACIDVGLRLQSPKAADAEPHRTGSRQDDLWVDVVDVVVSAVRAPLAALGAILLLVGRLKSLRMPEDAEQHVRDAIPRGERVHLVQDFITMGGLVGMKEVPCTLALTDTALWAFHWTGRPDRRRWGQMVAYGFSEISQVATQLVTMPIRNFYQLSFRLPGGDLGTIRIFKSPYVEGEGFISRFQELLAGHRSTTSPADELEKLSALAAEGVLTKDEWDRAKELYLGKSPDAREEALRLLGNLHEMERSGILSESEFNMKKWDVLARMR